MITCLSTLTVLVSALALVCTLGPIATVADSALSRKALRTTTARNL